ncbi:DNA-(apurinic or apyrimidinic site) lyase [Streptohalobacillus salinus]|uniref:Formamidopyrimidine-DNA glycosylase n=1 Tax=Streptohalobacillus salinus TaxID=621096 RepID=A0A2V3WN10_9BACI|nr:DNA-formamidopyrimidine glycosylase [Streptohalobacillus salinus]PXW90089.1 DNA-(apurinic or apyrimidinic site) lyase [Streptohalobacillus salinus]
MPELPEVETVRRTLAHLVIGETITMVDVFFAKIIKKPNDVDQFKQALVGQTIRALKRKGKFLMIELDDYDLISHLRMEGKYTVEEARMPVDKHTHIIFGFKSGKTLRYHDVRKFGTMHLFGKGEAADALPLRQVGYDLYLDQIDEDWVFEKITASTRAIKNILLDQTIVAGLGNIYVDETLFKSKIHPLTKGLTLSKVEVLRILDMAKLTIDEAVKQGGTSIRSYVDAKGDMGMFQQTLHAYGQTGEPCSVCEHPIEKMKLSGRGTHFCPVCQKEKNDSVRS